MYPNRFCLKLATKEICDTECMGMLWDVLNLGMTEIALEREVRILRILE